MLQIETRRIEPDITVLEFNGRIALGPESQRIEPLVRDLLRRDEKKLIFDLAGVDFVDSTGMGIVAYCSAIMTRAGGAFRVVGASGRVQQLFQITRLETFLPVYPTVAAACRGFALPLPPDVRKVR